jgi:hypothetical protein
LYPKPVTVLAPPGAVLVGAPLPLLQEIRIDAAPTAKERVFATLLNFFITYLYYPKFYKQISIYTIFLKITNQKTDFHAKDSLNNTTLI